MKTTIRAIAIALLLTCTVTGQAQPPTLTPAQIIDRLQAEINERIEKLRAELAPPPIRILSTREELDQAIATAADGAVLNLDSALQYPDPFVLSRNRITLQSVELRDGRMDLATPLPRFLKGITAAGDDITLRGLQATHTDHTTGITTISGARVTFDRMRILGDPVEGARRGITANGGGDVAIVRSYVADCFQAYASGRDSQALIAWDMLPGLLVDDDYLEGGSESVMFGGADSSDAAHQPAGVIIRNSTLTKKRAWKTLPIGVKNVLEFKAIDGAIVEGNQISESWGKAAGNGGGQDGYLVVLTVRNQDGRCPWCTIRNVIIRNNQLSNGAAAFTILGLDNIKETKTGKPTPFGEVRPTVRMNTVTIANNQATGLDAAGFSGSAKIILIDGGPIGLTFDGNVFQSVGSTSVVYLATATNQNLNLTRNTWPATTYGIFLNAVGRITAANWSTVSGGGTLADNVIK